MKDKLIQFFGKDFAKEERIESYDFIETYIEVNVADWTKAPDTDKIAVEFAKIINQLSDSDFIFLLCHSGYIPEFYEHDSSQETLYSKLIEVLICEWALRIGFKDAKIQKQKGGKEDVTLQYDNNIVVCDAKSFRLGRSQGAPNVKDVIKKADYEKWQEKYLNEPETTYGKYIASGGLITFPSLLKWKKGSDVYLYTTDQHKPILILFYEHLSFFLIAGKTYEILLGLLQNYSQIFPITTKIQSEYLTKVLSFLFGENNQNLSEYLELFDSIIKEKVSNTIVRIEDRIAHIDEIVKSEVMNTPEADLRSMLIETKKQLLSGQLMEQLTNIMQFRPFIAPLTGQDEQL